jgi:hypothetical protein
MMNGWKRTEFTDRGPDPTCSVTWAHKEAGIKITEFQGIYQTDKRGLDMDFPLVEFLGAELHKILELRYDCQQDLNEQARADAEYRYESDDMSTETFRE